MSLWIQYETMRLTEVRRTAGQIGSLDAGRRGPEAKTGAEVVHAREDLLAPVDGDARLHADTVAHLSGGGGGFDENKQPMRLRRRRSGH